MKKACGTALLIYAACVVVAGAVLYRRNPDSILAAFIAGIPLWFGITYIWEVVRRIKMAAMIRRALGGEGPRDGQRIAAIGRISPNGEALLAPFSKTRCVIYDYKIVTGFTSDDSNLYVGFAQIPSTIQTRQGSIRLFAHPDLKLREDVVPRDSAMPHAQEFVQATQFSETGLGNLGSSITTLMDAYKDDDGNIRYDNRAPSAQGIERAYFSEKLVRPGDEVCVIGQYSAQRNGIVPDLKSPLINQATLEPGGGDAPLRRARRGVIGYAIGACIFLGVVAVAFLWFVATNPLEAAEYQNPKMNPTWPEIRFEWFVDRWVRPRMSGAGMIQRGSIPNNLERGEARGRVKGGGQNLTVSRTAATRSNGVATVRVDDNAVVMTIDAKNRPLHVQVLGREVPPQSVDLDVSQAEIGISGRVSVRGDPAARVAFSAKF